MERLLTNTVNFLDQFLSHLSIAVASVLTINMVVAVFFRYVFDNPINWADDLSLYLFIWLTFLGGSLAIRKKQMISITILYDRLSKKVKITVYRVIQFLIIFFASIVLYYSIIWIIEPSTLNILSPTLGMDIWYFYTIIPLSMFCMIIFSIHNIIKGDREGFTE